MKLPGERQDRKKCREVGERVDMVESKGVERLTREGKKTEVRFNRGGGKTKWEMGVLSQTPPTPETREEPKACRLVARLVTNQSNKNRQSK